MRRSIYAVGLVAALGCSSPAGPQLGDQFSLRFGESASIAELGLWVRFINVVDDSRCPSDVVCAWAGDGAVLLEVAPLNGDSKEDVVHTMLEPQTIPLGRAELRLVRLDPYPATTQPIAPGDYVVTLVTRLTP
jgi:hypothetical protein